MYSRFCRLEFSGWTGKIYFGLVTDLDQTHNSGGVKEVTWLVTWKSGAVQVTTDFVAFDFPDYQYLHDVLIIRVTKSLHQSPNVDWCWGLWSELPQARKEAGTLQLRSPRERGMMKGHRSWDSCYCAVMLEDGDDRWWCCRRPFGVGVEPIWQGCTGIVIRLSTPGPRTAVGSAGQAECLEQHTQRHVQPWCRYQTRPCGPSLPLWPIIIQTLVWSQLGLKNPAWFWTWIPDLHYDQMLQGPGLVVTRGDNFSGIWPVLISSITVAHCQGHGRVNFNGVL